MSDSVITSDPLLTPNDSRYVMFPIQDNDIWKMYQKQVDCFWVPQEMIIKTAITDVAKVKFLLNMINCF